MQKSKELLILGGVNILGFQQFWIQWAVAGVGLKVGDCSRKCWFQEPRRIYSVYQRIMVHNHKRPRNLN